MLCAIIYNCHRSVFFNLFCALSFFFFTYILINIRKVEAKTFWIFAKQKKNDIIFASFS